MEENEKKELLSQIAQLKEENARLKEQFEADQKQIYSWGYLHKRTLEICKTYVKSELMTKEDLKQMLQLADKEDKYYSFDIDISSKEEL